MVKRSLFKKLSLMNPWYAAQTLFNPEMSENLGYNHVDSSAESRQERSVNNEWTPSGSTFDKSKFRAILVNHMVG